MHYVFHVSLLEQDITRRGRVDKPTFQLEFEDDSDSKEYKAETICDSAVYARESESGHLPGLYYPISWNAYLEEENTWEPVSSIQHLQKLVSTVHKEHLEKPKATFPPVNPAPLMAKPTVKLSPETSAAKQKQGRPSKTRSANKRAKNG